MARLVALNGAEPGRQFSLDGDECVVGRRLDCHVAVQDPRISRRHARFVRGPAGLQLEDLESVNGTFVNGRRVRHAEALADGDEVAVGAARFRVDLADDRRDVAPGQRVSILDATAHAPGMIEVANLQHDDAHLRDAGPVTARDPARELERLQYKLRTMYRLGEAVASALEPRALLDHVAALLLDVFVQARRAAAVTLDPRTCAPRTAAHAVRGAPASDTQTVIPAAAFDRVVRERHSVLLRSAPAVPPGESGAVVARESGAGDDPSDVTGWRMGAPLLCRGDVLGILYVESNAGEGAFTQADLDLLGGIAAQAGIAIHIAGLHQKLLTRDRLDQDLVIARQIQRNLLPREPPRLPGVEFGVHYEPAYEVGGDFFDFLSLAPHRLGVVVGDVSGKAISAALYMVRVLSEIRAAAAREPEPRRLVETVNTAVVDASDDGMFATAVVLSIDLARRTMRLTNAGHTVPLLRRGGRVIPLEFPEARCQPLGLDARAKAGEAEVGLEPGDLLLLYTDGLIEGRAPGGDFYGQERLDAVFARATGDARAVVSAVLADLDAFVQNAQQADDQTVVCLRIADAPAAD